MKTYYRKLIRDFIPEIMTQSGRSYELVRLGDQDYLTALKAKLVEEAEELTRAENCDQLVEELADLAEVIDTLMTTLDIDRQLIREIQQQKRLEKGGFKQRIMLIWTE